MNSTLQTKYHNALKYEIFVKEEYGFAKEQIRQASIIFDIWWHIWYFSQWCRELNNKAIIHYFEPIKENFNEAKRVLNNDDKIIFNNCWIARFSWTWILLFNEEKTMQSSKFTSFLNKNWIEKEVSFIQLSDYLKKYSLSKIDVLKIDIEGMEFEVLSTWKEEWNIIKCFIAEIHLFNDEFKKYWKLLLETLKTKFTTVEIIPSWYHESIFLVFAY